MTLNNFIDEKILSNISKTSFKTILEYNFKIRKRKFTISTDAKKSIIRFVFTLILKTINLANQKCNNCVISHTDIITSLKSVLDVTCVKYCVKDEAIANINKNIKESNGINNLKDLQKIEDLSSIRVLNKFVKNNSKHKVDKSGLIAITVLSEYLFAEAIELSINIAQDHTSIIRSFHFIYAMFKDDEFNQLIKKHNILSTSVYNKLLLQFNSYKNFPTIKTLRKLVLEITYESLF